MQKQRKYKTKENGKKATGRPTVMTPETISKLETAFSVGCSDLEACFHAGIGKTQLYDYQKEHPEFQERKAGLKEKMVLKSRMVVAQALNEGDIQTAKWYLERRKKEEFSTHTSIEANTTIHEDLDLTKLSTDELLFLKKIKEK